MAAMPLTYEMDQTTSQAVEAYDTYGGKLVENPSLYVRRGR